MFECPVPEPVSDRIQMAHGGGGRLMNELIRSVFLSAFGSPSEGCLLYTSDAADEL